MADLPPSMQLPQSRGKAMAKLLPVKRRSMPILLATTAIRKGTSSLIAKRRKKDKADGKKKDKESGSGAKAINSHVVKTTASIKEVNDIGVSLCTVTKSHWLMDSGATHHITPHHSDFVTYQPIKGSICISDKQELSFHSWVLGLLHLQAWREYASPLKMQSMHLM